MMRTGSRDVTKSLPADIRAAFQPRTYYQGMMGVGRLANNADVVQQGGLRGLRGLRGLGDCSVDPNDPEGGFICTDVTPPTGDSNTVTLQFPQTSGGGGGGGGGSTTPVTVDWTKILTASSDAIAKTLAASNPGTVYRGPGGTIYTQTPGQPVNPGTGTLLTGTGLSTGIGGNTLLLVGAAVVVALLMGGRR